MVAKPNGNLDSSLFDIVEYPVEVYGRCTFNNTCHNVQNMIGKRHISNALLWTPSIDAIVDDYFCKPKGVTYYHSYLFPNSSKIEEISDDACRLIGVTIVSIRSACRSVEAVVDQFEIIDYDKYKERCDIIDSFYCIFKSKQGY